MFVPEISASPRFFHTAFHVLWTQSLVIRVSWIPDSTLIMLCNVSYFRLLYDDCDSELPCGTTYSASITYRLRYSIIAGIRPLKCGFLLCNLKPQNRIHSALFVPELRPVSACGRETMRDSSPSYLLGPNLPPLPPVEDGHLDTEYVPFPYDPEIYVLSCRTLSSGGG